MAYRDLLSAWLLKNYSEPDEEVSMVTIPSGFNVSALVTDLVGCAAPFVVIAVVCVTYRFIRKALGA